LLETLMFRWMSARLAAPLAAVAALAGCGGADVYDRLPISGQVTLDGKPLQDGYVVFEPKAGQPTQSGGMIQGGKFDVPREDGAVAGLYSVGIFSGATAPTGVEVATPEAEKASRRGRGEIVPRRYNIDSILTSEIKAEGPNVFQYELSTKTSK
jgi:hypothetical protein